MAQLPSGTQEVDLSAIEADVAQALADAAAAQATADAAAALPTFGSRLGVAAGRLSITQLHALADVADLIASPGSATLINPSAAQSMSIASGQLLIESKASGDYDWSGSWATFPGYGWLFDPRYPGELAAWISVADATTVSALYESVGLGVANYESMAPTSVRARISGTLGASWAVAGDGVYSYGSGANLVSDAAAEAGYWLRVRWGATVHVQRNAGAYASEPPTTGWVSMNTSGAPPFTLAAGQAIWAGFFVRTSNGKVTCGAKSIRVMGVPL